MAQCSLVVVFVEGIDQVGVMAKIIARHEERIGRSPLRNAVLSIMLGSGRRVLPESVCNIGVHAKVILGVENVWSATHFAVFIVLNRRIKRSVVVAALVTYCTRLSAVNTCCSRSAKFSPDSVCRLLRSTGSAESSSCTRRKRLRMFD